VAQMRAAIWTRGSTHDQHTGNQLAELRAERPAEGRHVRVLARGPHGTHGNGPAGCVSWPGPAASPGVISLRRPCRARPAGQRWRPRRCT